ncbi:MAG: glycosyltransferase family 4 protein [Candidatus Sumerlaeia bacterium]
MRILYLCCDLGIPILGRRGCSTHVRETCRALQEKGHEVTILCSMKGNDEDLQSDLEIIELPPRRLRKLGYDIRNFWQNYPLYKKACQLMEERKFDACYERFSLYSLVGTWLGKKYRLPRIVEVNAFLSMEHSHKLHFSGMAKRAEKYIALRAPSLVVVSQPLHDSLVELGVESDRITNMPMAVDIDHFRPDQERRQAIRDKWKLDGKYVIGYVGSLSAWHGISFLPEISKKMLEVRDDFVIFVVGGNENHLKKHRKVVSEQKLNSHLIFAGSVPYQDVSGYINAMDVALVPDTNYWTCPTKMFEYQASCVPTIAPKLPAVERAMDHGEEGLLFPARDVNQLVELILSLADDAEKRETMGKKARERVIQTHSWQHNVEQIEKIYSDIEKGKISIEGSIGSK